MSTATHAPGIAIPAGEARLQGFLQVPPKARGAVVFSHGSGSGRHSPRNQFVATELRAAGFATLLLDLLTPAEDRVYETRFDIELLTGRLQHAIRYVARHEETRGLPIGLFGASTGAASALRCAAAAPRSVAAVVSRGGRPDLAGGAALRAVQAPTLLIVGDRDDQVIELNRAAAAELACPHELALVAHATHLFVEAGTLEEVSRLASRWFTRWLKPR